MDSDIAIRNRRAFDNWKVAAPWRRASAFVFDAFLGLALLYLLLFVTGHTATFLGKVFLWVVLMWGVEGLSLSMFGKTLGRFILRVKVYAPKYDGIPHPLQISLRILIFWLTAPPLGMGLTSVLYRRDRRGWHDLISETITIGPEKSQPSPAMEKMATGAMFFQALLVFAAFGALLLSAGLKQSGEIGTYASIEANGSCDDPGVFLKSTSDVFFALSVSPAWSECWSQASKKLQPIQDAKIARLADLARKYYDVWNVLPSQRNGLMKEKTVALGENLCRNRKDKACKTARYLASVTGNSNADSASAAWLKEHARFYRILLKAKSQRVRLGILKEQIPHVSGKPIVQSALQDRIWAEELAMGKPSGRPSSMNPRWNQEQICWAEALGYFESNKCGANPFLKPLRNLDRLAEDDMTLEDAESFLIEAEQEGHPTEFISTLKLWMAIYSQNSAEIEKGWASFPQTSPLYSYAKQWYQGYKQE